MLDNNELLQIGADEDSSSGSDSDPSEDNFELEDVKKIT